VHLVPGGSSSSSRNGSGHDFKLIQHLSSSGIKPYSRSRGATAAGTAAIIQRCTCPHSLHALLLCIRKSLRCVV
jgi:hypothetical protein